MLDYKRLLLTAAALWALAAEPALAASSNLFPMAASPTLPNANQYFYCPIVSGATTGTEYKCTAQQLAAFTYSLLNGDCTATGTGGITCTKTNGAAYGPLATAALTNTRAGDIIYWNGAAWVVLPGNNSGTQFLQETSVGVPSWAGGAGGVTSFSSTCPATGPSSGAVTLSNGIGVTAETTSYSVAATDCGTLFSVTGTNTQTLPGFSGGGSVAGGFAITEFNAGSGTVTITASSGTINANGTTATSVTLSPGQSMSFAVNAAVNGWIGVSQAASTPSPSISGPGYQASLYYNPPGFTPQGSALAPTSTTLAYCSPFWIGNISATGGGTATFGTFSIRAGVAGTTTATMALYANDASPSGGGAYRPGALLGASLQVADTSATFPLSFLSRQALLYLPTR